MSGNSNDWVAPPIIPTLLFSEEALSQFFRRVALARAIGVTTNFKWESANTTVLNVVYGLKYCLTLGNSAGAGYLAEKGASNTELRDIVERQLPGLHKTFREKARLGASHLVPWLEGLEKSRQRDIREIKQLQLEARRTNEEVDRMINEAIFYISTIKFASEIALATMGMLPFGGAAGVALRLGIGLGYPVFLSLLDIANGKQASIVGSCSMVAGTGAKAVADNAASFVGEGEGPVIKAAEAHFVDKHNREIEKLKLRRKMHGGLSKKGKANIKVHRTQAMINKMNINIVGALAGGVSVWFYHRSCQESAQSYWEAIEGL